MLTKNGVAVLAGATLAVGLLVGAAGTLVIRDASVPSTSAAQWADQLRDMGSFMSGAGGVMSGAGMMSGGGMMSGAGMMSGLSRSTMPDWMRQYHGLATPAPSR